MSSSASWGVQALESSAVFQWFDLVIIVLNTNLIPWPRKWQIFEGNPPLLIQLMLKLISTLRLSPSAFEVSNSFVLPFKRSRLEHAPRSQRLCQDVQRLFAFRAKEVCPTPNQGGDFSRMRLWVLGICVGQTRWILRAGVYLFSE